MKIKYEVVSLVNVDIDSAFSILKDIQNYPSWWGFKIDEISEKAGIIYFRIISFLPYFKIKWKVSVLNSNQIQCEYLAGLYSGTGIWTLKSISSNITSVSYYVSLNPESILAYLIIKSGIFKVIHKKDILSIINNIYMRKMEISGRDL